MLILSRQCNESIHLGDHIVLTIVSIAGEKVRIGVEAPDGIRILRRELDKHTETPANTPIETPPFQQRRAA